MFLFLLHQNWTILSRSSWQMQTIMPKGKASKMKKHTIIQSEQIVPRLIQNLQSRYRTKCKMMI